MINNFHYQKKSPRLKELTTISSNNIIKKPFQKQLFGDDKQFLEIVFHYLQNKIKNQNKTKKLYIRPVAAGRAAGAVAPPIIFQKYFFSLWYYLPVL